MFREQSSDDLKISLKNRELPPISSLSSNKNEFN